MTMDENQQYNQPSGIKCENVPKKSELKEILKTVSSLCPLNLAKTGGLTNDHECKIISGDDELEIIDVIIYPIHKKKMSLNKFHSPKNVTDSANAKKNENDISANIAESVDSQVVGYMNINDIYENNTDSVDIQVDENINANDISENITDSVDSQVIEYMNINDISENNTDSVYIQVDENINANDISENITDSVDFQIVQNINANDICDSVTHSVAIQKDQTINKNNTCKNSEAVIEEAQENELCNVSAREHLNKPESISETYLAPVNKTIDGTYLNSYDNSEKCVTKSTIGKIREHETTEGNAMCHEIMDVTDETNEHYSYEIEYDFDTGPPQQITGSWKEFSAGRNNYTRGCKWAPDGSCIMTNSDDNILRIFNLPPQLWDSSQWCNISEMEAVLKISEGDTIYDYCWYPLMNSNDPCTCCLVSTSRKSTIHLWDAYTGELRSSYRCFNHLDELVTPHSLCFDSDGQKLFCGFHNVIRVFDVNRPGREFEERQVYGHKMGQCGIISCFAFTSADKNVSAAGSYQRSIGLYAEPNGELLCLLEGQGNGVTHLQFSPDGNYLYSGGRKDPDIICWDIRNLGNVLFSLRRSCDTNQRMYFDISRCGKYVVSGNQNGVITFWDVTAESKIIEKSPFPVLVPVRFYMAHDDCVNGVSFHPFYPLFCSSSGQRKFPELLDDDSEDIFSYDFKKDNSLRLWWIGK